MKPIQKGTTGQALAAEYGLKGRVLPTLDEIVVPITHLQDITTGPNRVPRSVMAVATKAAVVDQFSYAGIEAGAGRLLIVRALLIDNIQGANMGIVLKLDIPGLALTRTFAAAPYVDGRGVVSPHRTYSASNALALGTTIGALAVLNAAGRDIALGVPIVLTGPDGRTGGVAAGLMVTASAQNRAVQCTFECDEYELPG